MELKVVIPRRLTLAEHVFSLNLDKMDLTKVEQIDFDFRPCTFGEPFAMLLLANKIRQLASKWPKVRYSLLAGKEPFHTFADHIGFFRFAGWPRGRRPGEAWGSRSYLPIETFNVGALTAEASSGPVGAIINKEADRLTEVLSQSSNGAVFDILQYAIREILRNAVEHSKGHIVSLVAQHFPNKQRTEIVIADDGVGIPTNLYDNEYVECETPRDALKFALLPGISGVTLAERSNQDRYWGNSGFGLFVTSRICSENGTFRIISDRQGLTLKNDKQIEHDWFYQGTCVQMTIETGKAKSIQDNIAHLIDEGEATRSEFMASYPIQASAASKMLSSQYKKVSYL